MIEKWQQRYLAHDYCPNEKPDPLIVLAAERLPTGHAIDLACGAGRHALHLAQHGWRVTAIDGAPAALALFDAPGITKLELDLEQNTPPLQADLIVDTLYLDRRLFPLMHTQAGAVALVLPTHDDDPAVKPMNPAFLIDDHELAHAFRSFTILHQAVRKQPSQRRMLEFLAARKG